MQKRCTYIQREFSAPVLYRTLFLLACLTFEMVKAAAELFTQAHERLAKHFIEYESRFAVYLELGFWRASSTVSCFNVEQIPLAMTEEGKEWL